MNMMALAWNDLPRYVLLIIFNKLGIEDLIKGAPLCCTSWYHTSKHPSLWLRPLVLNTLQDDSNSSIRYKRKFINSILVRSQWCFTSLKFPLSYFTVDLLDHLAVRCPKLKYLHLEVEGECSCKSDIMNKTLDKLCSLMFELKELDGMAITCTTIPYSGALKILQQISKFCPNFNKLKILDELSNSLAYAISKTLPNLKVLDLSNTTTTPEAVLTILNRCNKLESLDITGCSLIQISNNSKIAGIADLRLNEFNYDNYDKCNKDNDLFDASIDRAAWSAVSVPTLNSKGFEYDNNDLPSFIKPAPWGGISVPTSNWKEFKCGSYLPSFIKPDPRELCCSRSKYYEYERACLLDVLDWS